jgi:hypothetical protein
MEPMNFAFYLMPYALEYQVKQQAELASSSTVHHRAKKLCSEAELHFPNTMTVPDFSDLPPEIWVKILHELSYRSRLVVFQTCWKLQCLKNTPSLWKIPRLRLTYLQKSRTVHLPWQTPEPLKVEVFDGALNKVSKILVSNFGGLFKNVRLKVKSVCFEKESVDLLVSVLRASENLQRFSIYCDVHGLGLLALSEEHGLCQLVRALCDLNQARLACNPNAQLIQVCSAHV